MFRVKKRPRVHIVRTSNVDVPYVSIADAVATVQPEAKDDVTAAAKEPDVLSDPLSLMHMDTAPAIRHLVTYKKDLSVFLKSAGNARAWREVAKAIRAGSVVLLHGPHGCGKTAGVHDLANNHLGMAVYEINPGNTEGIDTFVRDVNHVRRVKTLLGPRIVLIDDIEGFDELYIKKAVDLVKQHRSGDTSVVLTTSNVFERSIFAFRSNDALIRVRMYEPSSDQMQVAARSVFMHNRSLGDIAARESRGNFHQLFLRLKLFVNSSPDMHVDLFKTTTLLLQKSASVEDWRRAGESDVLVGLLYENAPNIADALNDIVEFTNRLSECEVLRRCEEFGLTLVGMAAQQHLHVQNVPVMRFSRSSVARGHALVPLESPWPLQDRP